MIPIEQHAITLLRFVSYFSVCLQTAECAGVYLTSSEWPIWMQNLQWLLAAGDDQDFAGRLTVLEWAAPHVEAWIDATRDEEPVQRMAVARQLYAWYSEMGDLSQLWGDIDQKPTSLLTPVLVAHRRLSGLMRVANNHART